MVVLQWFKKYLEDFKWKDFGYLIIIVVLFLCYIRSCHSVPVVPSVSPGYKPVEHITDTHGTPYTQVQGVLYTPEQMKHVTDSMSKALGKGKIVHVVETITVIDTQYKTKEVYIDTINGTVSAQDSNKNSQLSFTGNYRSGTGTFKLKLTPDTATYATTIKSHWFKADEMNVNIYHTNDLFAPAQGRAYTAKVPKIIGCVGPVIAVGYNGTVVPFIGVGITLNVWGIKSKK